MWLFLAFLLVPIIEIALFIQVDDLIGLWPTLGLVVLTAILGASMVRSQGLNAMSRVQGSFSSLSDPTEPLAEGAMILFSGALLLTPGFFTDTVGFALLIPAVRKAIIKRVKSRVRVQTFGTEPQHPRGPAGGPDVIDGDYEEVPPQPRDGPSGWTKH